MSDDDVVALLEKDLKRRGDGGHTRVEKKAIFSTFKVAEFFLCNRLRRISVTSVFVPREIPGGILFYLLATMKDKSRGLRYRYCYSVSVFDARFAGVYRFSENADLSVRFFLILLHLYSVNPFLHEKTADIGSTVTSDGD